MRALLQRVTYASVTIDGSERGRIDSGLLILLGVRCGDSIDDAKWLAEKCINLRIFEDDTGKMNRSLLDVGGGALVISQFTLYGDARKGRRPSFSDAAPPEESKTLYEAFVQLIRSSVRLTQTGVFGADMKVSIVNDGPVTVLVER